MELIYREIAELSEIFDVKERGDALISELKKREADAVASILGASGKDLPVVYRWAYDYSVPGAAEDFIPQNVPSSDGVTREVHA
jgi:iron complex transport system substrate-binding protein